MKILRIAQRNYANCKKKWNEFVYFRLLPKKNIEAITKYGEKRRKKKRKLTEFKIHFSQFENTISATYIGRPIED